MFISNPVVGPNTSKGRAEIDSFLRVVVETWLIPGRFVGATNAQEEIYCSYGGDKGSG
jgi:hypothetical protein